MTIAKLSEAKRFDLNTQWMPISVLVLAAPIVIMSVQAFYKVDRAAQDIVHLNAKIEKITADVSGIGNNSARTEAKLDMIAELVKEIRENQKKGH